MTWPQVKKRPWEKRLVDESCGREVVELLKKAALSERDYLKALPQAGTTHNATYMLSTRWMVSLLRGVH